MSRTLMVDPSGGYKYGFPKHIPEAEGIIVEDMDLEELKVWLFEHGYPEDQLEFAGWTRFMWKEIE